MATFVDLKADLEAHRDYLQKKIDWVEGVNSNTFTVYRNDTSHTFTGTGGATAFWADWRSNNSSLDGNNGTEDENFIWELWTSFQNDGVDDDADTLAAQKAKVVEYNNNIAEHQAHIDAGRVDDTELPTAEAPPSE